MSEAANSVAETPIRDIRVDAIGFVNELVAHFANELKTKVKSGMMEKGAERAEGDAFDALLVAGEISTVDPAKFLRKYEKGEISKKDFLSAISVARGKAEEFMAPRDLDLISDTKASSPSLRVTRKKGVNPTLVESVKAVGAAVA